MLRGLWLWFGLVLALWLSACRGGGGATPADAPLLLPLLPTAAPVAATPTLAAGAAVVVPTPAVANAAAPTPDAAADGIGDPYTPHLGNLGYDVNHYALRLQIDPANPLLTAHTTVTATVTTASLPRLSLDFVGFTVTDLAVNGVPASYLRDGDKLRIDLREPMPVGSLVRLDIHYEGVPVRYTSPYLGAAPLGLQWSTAGTVFAFSEPDGARTWFPANDHPRDKAIFRIELIVPADVVGVANGVLWRVEERGGGTRYIWRHDYPMATYLAVVAVGPFARVDSVADNGVPLRNFVLPDAGEAMARYEGVNEAALAWLADRLGPYPFETYGYVTVDLGGVSMETQTMVLLSTGMIGERTMVHELAHMWFGNWVSLDSWSEIWRNEGFATYFQLLWEYRDDPDGLDQELAGIAAAVDEDARDYPLGQPPPAQLFGFETYFKGALLAHALRLEVGDEAFYRGLRAYFSRYGGGSASQAQFAAVMAEAAGRPLGDFFAGWLE